MYAPGVLWTAAHHRIPLLIVMHNNRAYHQEVMWFQREALSRNRGVELAHTGFGLGDPNIDFAKMAQSMGVAASGPITDPEGSRRRRFNAALAGREARRAVPDRRRDATAMIRRVAMKCWLPAIPLSRAGQCRRRRSNCPALHAPSGAHAQSSKATRPSAANGKAVFMRVGC